MQLNIGDRVKAHTSFDFKRFSGPNSPEDLGTVVAIRDDGWVDVKWESTGREADHEVENNDPANDCAVVLAA